MKALLLVAALCGGIPGAHVYSPNGVTTVGAGWGFNPKREQGDYFVGDLVSPKGVVTKNARVSRYEWQCR